MFPPWRTLFNPLGQNRDVALPQRLFLVRHAILRILGSDPSNHFTVIRIPRNDAPFSGLCSVNSLVAEENAEIAVALDAAMTADAVLVENGLNVRAEVDPPFAAGP